MKTIIAKTATAAAFAFLMATPAFAALQTIQAGSNLDIVGSLQPVGGVTVISNATGFDFGKAGVYGTPGGTISLGGGGTLSFAAFTTAGCPLAASDGGCGTIQDIASFGTAFGGSTAFTGLSPFFTVTEGANTLSFSLTSIDNVVRVPGVGQSSLVLNGTGTFALTGYANTQASFAMTVQGNGQTTFSASTLVPSPVPEPATFLLLGAGLLGTLAIRKRRANQAL